MTFSRLKIWLFILVASLLSIFGAYGQYLDKKVIIPPSPESSKLISSLKITDPEATGAASVGLPLADMAVGDAKVSLTLQYSSLNNRVDQISSQIGLGWSLNGLGMVSRVMRGHPDEQEHGFLNYSQIPGRGYADLSSIDPIDAYAYAELSSNCGDVEPDMFYMNINNIKAVLMFDWDGSLKVSSDKKIKVLPIYSSGTVRHIESWNLIDDQGITYVFSGVETTNVQSFSSLCNSNLYYSSWYITKITDVYSNEINFEYTGSNIQADYSHSYSTEHVISSIPNGSSGIGNFQGTNIRRDNLVEYGSIVPSRIWNNRNGQEIVFSYLADRADINKSSTTKAKRLTSIQNKIETVVVNSFVFVQDYSTNRLMLKKLELMGKLVKKGEYQFQYHEGLLPEKESLATDLWGYYNGKSNLWPVPPAIVTNALGGILNAPGGDRSPDFNYSKLGLLKKIIYPTAGSTLLEYEANEYSWVQSTAINEQSIVSASYSAAASGNCNSPGGSCATAFTETPFVVVGTSGIPVPVAVSLNFALSQVPYFGGSKAPNVTIYKNGVAIVNFGPADFIELNSSRTEYITLLPGEYILHASAHYIDDPSGNADHASATIQFDKPGPVVITKKVAGGNRLKSRTDISNDGPSQTISYTYGWDGGLSSGVLNSSGVYKYNDVRLADNTPYTYELTIRTSFSASVQALMNGYHLNYRRVLKEMSGNGKVIKEFSTLFDFPAIESNTPPFVPPVTNDYLLGNLLREKTVSQNGLEYVDHTMNYGFTYLNIPGVKVDHMGGQEVGPTFINNYRVATYNNALGFSRLIKSEERRLERSGGEIAKTNLFEYDSNMQNISKEKLILNDYELHTAYFYPEDFVSPNSTITALKNLNLKGVALEKITSISRSGVSKVTGAEYNEFSLNGTKPYLYKRYSLDKITMPIADYEYAYLKTTALLTPDTRMSIMELNNALDVEGKPTTSFIKGIKKQSFIWDSFGHLTALVDNAEQKDIAYTSFEDGEKNSWIYTGVRVSDPTSPTGSQAYDLVGGQLSKVGLSTSSSYVLTYWAKSNAAGNISGGLAEILANKNGWTQYQRKFTGLSSVTLNGSFRIDELRLYPDDAAMVSYTYEPLIGMTSQTDAKRMTTSYTYDTFNRLENIKDQQGNIVKNFRYNYANGSSGSTTYYSALLTVSKTKICNVGQTGSVVNYIVTAGKYTSTVSQADADQQAQADATANAQAYANTQGTCGGQAPGTFTLEFSSPIGFSFDIKVLDPSTNSEQTYTASGSAMINMPSGGGYIKVSRSQAGVATFAYSIPGRTFIGDTVQFNNVSLIDTIPLTITQVTFGNNALQITKTKNNCGVNQVGSQVVYHVAADQYLSNLSQADADQKAIAGEDFNALVNANILGTCSSAPTTYYNTVLTVSKTKDCSPGQTGSTVSYTVAAGTYSSTVSQADANQKAQADVNANAQNYANAQGSCSITYYNTALTVSKTKDCSPGQTGSTVSYTVAAGTYSSNISQADANQQAQADANANAQNYANAQGSCSITYYNNTLTVSKTKNNCSSGQVGSVVEYTVAQGAYSSTISQLDANAKAQADADANAQNYANSNGSCSTPFSLGFGVPYGREFRLGFYNTATSVWTYYTLNSAGGLDIRLPEGTYTITVNEVNYTGDFSFYFTHGATATGNNVQFGPVFLSGSGYLEITGE